jgi:hypothetical protein
VENELGVCAPWTNKKKEEPWSGVGQTSAVVPPLRELVKKK